MKRDVLLPALAKLRATIRSAGLRSTGPRVAVLQRLHAAITPVSHADLVADLEPQGFDRATIYRNLMDLTEAGVLSRTDLGDHVWRFELRRHQHGLSSQHPHFMCIDCGKVSCLPDVRVRISPTRGIPRAVSTRRVEVQLKGRCDRCAA